VANRGAILLSIFKRRRFPVAIILLCVRWYCKYGISYRDLAEMMSERGTMYEWADAGGTCFARSINMVG
jgi:transposase-like protein